jgi:hypothetical protein
LDGFELCRRLLANGSQVPVLFCRSGMARADDSIMVCADLLLDDDAHRVTRAGIAVIAVMLGVVRVAITKITENNLLSQVDRQLTAAVGPIRDFDDFGRSGGAAGGPDDQAPNDKTPPSRSLSSLYVGIVDGTDVDTVPAAFSASI